MFSPPDICLLTSHLAENLMRDTYLVVCWGTSSEYLRITYFTFFLKFLGSQSVLISVHRYVRSFWTLFFLILYAIYSTSPNISRPTATFHISINFSQRWRKCRFQDPSWVFSGYARQTQQTDKRRARSCTTTVFKRSICGSVSRTD